MKVVKSCKIGGNGEEEVKMTLRGTWGLEGRANFNVLSYLWLVRTGSKLFSLDFFPFSFKMNIA